ncbi:MAG TPA: hypothetical protein VMS55_03070 [Myxococcota bacterium]|nr:hypothetical protein [Myxococcota bacterium]
MERLFYLTQDLLAQGVERHALRQLVRTGRIRSKKVGRQLHLSATDVHRELGFDAPAAEQR